MDFEVLAVPTEFSEKNEKYHELELNPDPEPSLSASSEISSSYSKIRKEKEKARSAGTPSNKNSDRPAQKCFRCGSEDHLIAKCPKPPKDSEKRCKSEKAKEKGNSAKDNSDDDDDLKVYASMAKMSNDDVRENKDYGDSSQLTNWILDSGATCHMTPEVTDFIPGSL